MISACSAAEGTGGSFGPSGLGAAAVTLSDADRSRSRFSASRVFGPMPIASSSSMVRSVSLSLSLTFFRYLATSPSGVLRSTLDFRKLTSLSTDRVCAYATRQNTRAAQRTRRLIGLFSHDVWRGLPGYKDVPVSRPSASGAGAWREAELFPERPHCT